LKKSIFLTALLLLSVSFLGVAQAKKDNNYSAKQNIASMREKSAPPKKKVAKAKAIRVLATAYYTPVKGQDEYATKSFRGDMKLNGGGKTSSGKTPEEGMVATDPRVIPTGTELYIPELKLYAVAEDTGEDIKGKRIDVYTGIGETGLREALDIGRKMVTVIIIKRAKRA
jgi:3D (Asp-Asp-Asp) domain-containing protein